ncbi:ComEA family DNA-binding protein [Ekhidna sp.]
MKDRSYLSQDSSALKWIEEVHSSIELKKVVKAPIDNGTDIKKKNFDAIVKVDRTELPSLGTHAIPEILDLNQASAEELRKVKGIGPAYSERIVKYRNMLGGFNDTTQLEEVYGLESGVISELLKNFAIQSSVSRFEINSDSIKSLVKHPYISYDLARVIINYRKVHGDINTAEEFRKIKAVDEYTFLRLKPYLE